MRHVLLATVLLAGSASAPAYALSPSDVSRGFREGAVSYCLEGALRGVGLAELPPELMSGIAPADESMRGMVKHSNPTGPIWDVLSARGIVLISEPKAGVCEVVGYGAPVEATFKATLKDARKRSSELAPIPAEAGYDPIVYQLEQTVGAASIMLRLSGAEPGTPGHAFRFSMLSAVVRRAPSTP